MNDTEFNRLMRYDRAKRAMRSFSYRTAVSKRSAKSVGNATGRTDLKRSRITSPTVDNIVNTRVTYALLHR